MERIEISTIRPGLRFTKPVFFDDGKNMFIEAGIHIKPYHVAALTKWHIPFLLSDGHVLEEGEEVPDETDSIDDLDSLDSVEEIDEIEQVDEIEEVSALDDLTEALDADIESAEPVTSINTGDDGFVDFLEEL